MLSILYEDNYLIAVDKPHGVQVEKSRNFPSLEEQVSNYLHTEYPWKKQWSAGVVHRLDRPVCGVVVFAKTRMALKSLNLQFEQRSTRKIYYAWIENKPPETSGELLHLLVKDMENRKALVTEHTGSDARVARLRYRLLTCQQNFSLVEIELLTGRYHQIRAQFAAVGSPIIGDLKYGASSELPGGMILLQARELQLRHPKTGESVIVRATDPEEWKKYLPA